MHSRTSLSKLLILTALFLSACTAAIDPAAEIAATGHAKNVATHVDEEVPADLTQPQETAGSGPVTTERDDAVEPKIDLAPDRQTATNPRVEVPDVSVNWLLPWDGIRPIYDPEFASAAEAPLDDDELVLAISLDGEAKAYPITVLRSREMVNDEMAGIPTLVTW
jgi:hypothetical protein